MNPRESPQFAPGLALAFISSICYLVSQIIEIKVWISLRKQLHSNYITVPKSSDGVFYVIFFAFKIFLSAANLLAVEFAHQLWTQKMLQFMYLLTYFVAIFYLLFFKTELFCSWLTKGNRKQQPTSRKKSPLNSGFASRRELNCLCIPLFFTFLLTMRKVFEIQFSNSEYYFSNETHKHFQSRQLLSISDENKPQNSSATLSNIDPVHLLGISLCVLTTICDILSRLVISSQIRKMFKMEVISNDEIKSSVFHQLAVLFASMAYIGSIACLAAPHIWSHYFPWFLQATLQFMLSLMLLVIFEAELKITGVETPINSGSNDESHDEEVNLLVEDPGSENKLGVLTSEEKVTNWMVGEKLGQIKPKKGKTKSQKRRIKELQSFVEKSRIKNLETKMEISDMSEFVEKEDSLATIEETVDQFSDSEIDLGVTNQTFLINFEGEKAGCFNVEPRARAPCEIIRLSPLVSEEGSELEMCDSKFGDGCSSLDEDFYNFEKKLQEKTTGSL